MSQRRKSMLMGVLTSIGAYVFPILAWGYITNGRIGTVLYTFVWLGILKLFERRSQDTQEQPTA
jgi:hypothetical protein